MNTDRNQELELATEAQRAQSGADSVSSSCLSALRVSVADPSSSVLIGAPSVATPLPVARVPVTVRPATLDDLPFIDALQKKHSKQLGFMSRATLEGKVRLGHVLIAEE